MCIEFNNSRNVNEGKEKADMICWQIWLWGEIMNNWRDRSRIDQSGVQLKLVAKGRFTFDGGDNVVVHGDDICCLIITDRQRHIKYLQWCFLFHFTEIQNKNFCYVILSVFFYLVLFTNKRGNENNIAVPCLLQVRWLLFKEWQYVFRLCI